MLHSFDKNRPELKPYGLFCCKWSPSVMSRPDRHNEIEINFIPSGSLTYLFNGQKIKITENQLIAFWALTPHQIIESDDASPYYVCTIPFKDFVQWNLPVKFTNRLFNGEILVETSTVPRNFEVMQFEKWETDLNNNQPEARQAAIYEIHARLYRMSVELSTQKNVNTQPTLNPAISMVEKMAIFIAHNYTHHIKASDVGKAFDLNPDYANTVFKKTFDKTIKEYLTDQRILHAQRLLSTTNKKIIEVALNSGFKTISRFNAAFLKKEKCTPHKYRTMHCSLA